MKFLFEAPDGESHIVVCESWDVAEKVAVSHGWELLGEYVETIYPGGE